MDRRSGRVQTGSATVPNPEAPGGPNSAKAYIQTINVPIDHNVVIETVAATSGSSLWYSPAKM